MDSKGPRLTRSLLVVLNSFCFEEWIVHCDEPVLMAVSLFKDSDISGILLRVLSESAMAFIDRGRIETRSPWDDYFCLISVMNSIILGSNSFTRL